MCIYDGLVENKFCCTCEGQNQIERAAFRDVRALYYGKSICGSKPFAFETLLKMFLVMVKFKYCEVLFLLIEANI